VSNGATDAAAFSHMSERDQHMHLYQRLVSIETSVVDIEQAARKAADCAEAVKATLDTEIDKHATACLTARKEEAAAVDKTQTKYMGIIVLLVGLLCTAIGYVLA
jgi:predicted ATP-binding protein involved in virulence